MVGNRAVGIKHAAQIAARARRAVGGTGQRLLLMSPMFAAAEVALMIRGCVLAVLVAALWGGPALAKGEGGFGLDVETMLIEDKTVVGIGGYGIYKMVGLDLGFALAWLDEEDPRPPVEGSFLGGLFQAHVFVHLGAMRPLVFRVGTGLDAWLLWGIDEDEQKYAMPFFGEVRYFIGDTLNVFVQPRYYLFESDGLEVGVAPDGDEGSPFLFTVGLGGEWR